MRLALRVRIRRIPPTPVLEGIDFRQYDLRPGQVCDLKPDEAMVLLLWGYAEPADENGEAGSLGTYRVVQ